MVQIKLTEVQHNNLIEFLKRVDLKGHEVPAYVDVANVIRKAVEQEE